MRIQFLSKLSLRLFTPIFLFIPSFLIGQGIGSPPHNFRLGPIPSYASPVGVAESRPLQNSASRGKTQSVTPLLLGTSPNFFSSAFPMNHNLAADDSTGTVVFVHRNNPAVMGGVNTGLRYDVSTNGGTTWAKDIGILNPIYLAGRFPQIAMYSPPGNTSPTNSRVVFAAENVDGGLFRGFDFGVNRVQNTNPLPTMQNALFLPAAKHLANGGLCEGLKGEYWAARISANATQTSDSLLIFKGVYNPVSESMQWSLADIKIIPWSLSYDGLPHIITPSVSFSPDGMVGWIAMLGDLSAGPDSLFAPILLKSTDGGNTWGNPTEIDLNSFPWVSDTLKVLWVDSLGQPYSSGRVTTAFEYDLTVDGNGNPHMFFVIGSATTTFAPDPSYSIYPTLAKYAVDLSSTNLGNSYTLSVVSPVLTFRGSFGMPTAIAQDHYPQISRTHSGSHIFYSWVDTDTSVYGYGYFFNNHPNLYICSRQISDGKWACVQPITSGDIFWDGIALSPQMGPEVLMDNAGGTTRYSLPIVMTNMSWGDPTAECEHFYFGGEAYFFDNSFAYPPNSWNHWLDCNIVISTEPAVAPSLKVYPHPISNGAKLLWEGWNGRPWQFELMDMQGRQVARKSQIHAAEWEFERGHLPAGLYVYRITSAGGQPVSGKLVLE